MSFKKFLSIFICSLTALTAIISFDLSAGADIALAAAFSAPKISAANASASSVKLSWKKVKSAKKYVVYRSTNKSKGFKAVKTLKSSKLSYTDKKLKLSKTYYYKVKAVNGNKSKISKAVKITCKPAAVKNISYSQSSCGEIALYYGKSSGASGYEIKYSGSKNGSYSLLKRTSELSVKQLIGIDNTVYYKIRAYKLSKGKRVYSSYSKVFSATAAGHNYAITSKIEPTCKTTGSIIYTCTICSDTYVEPQSEIGSHSYTSTVTEPTCTAQGYTVHTCTICGISYTDSYTPATGEHKYGSYTVEKEPTCGEIGIKTAVCTVCSAKKTEEMEATGEHKYSQYEVTAPASCTEDGLQTASCQVCGKIKTKVIDKTGHDFSVSEPIIEATCTESGKTKLSCSYCGEEKIAEAPALGHDYQATTIESNEPKDVEQCTRCNDIKLHTLSSDYDIKLENGKAKVQCESCGQWFSPEGYISHDLSTTDYTVSESNKLQAKCTTCGEYIDTDTYTVDISSLTDFELGGVAKYESEKHKLTLISSGIVRKFDISGTAESLTISVDATDASIDTDIKLNSVSITNNDNTLADDCIRINDKTPSDDGAIDAATGLATDKLPSASITAKNGTANVLKITAESGNAIESEAKLELKGQGSLTASAVKTAISCAAKLEIKNLTLDISSSQNRGIDMKKDELYDANGNVAQEKEYFNIEFAANATVTINAYDDGIRCKNITFNAINTTENPDDIGSVVTVTSQTGDAIQLEGKKGISMQSGTMTLNGFKTDINAKKVPASGIVVEAGATLNYDEAKTVLKSA